MSDPEMNSRAGEDVSPAQELKSALADFVAGFQSHRAATEDRFQQQEERLTMYERKSLSRSARPALAGAATETAPHEKAFGAYLRNGDEDALRGIEMEGKAMSTAVAADGGYLVDPQTSETVQSVLRGAASLRAIASVVNVEATSYDVLVDHSDANVGWASETASSTETGTPQVDRISIALHELSALPKVSQRLLDDSAFDIETWLAGKIADKFARAESDAFILGDGIDKPTGILNYTTAANGTEVWGELGHIATGVDGGFAAVDAGDAIVDLVYGLAARYRANGVFVMNSKTAGRVRKMKDGDGRFLWSDGFAAGEPSLLLGYKVVICEDMPDIASDAYAIAFGDFGAGYTIAERPDLRVLR
ncbi:phage major capsid protein, partial [Planktotalea sp.]|uniref:phage major capsid protein n=1 Tax=Planktotalea sp. TaxID=2029877 RepID=UPI0032990EDE